MDEQKSLKTTGECKLQHGTDSDFSVNEALPPKESLAEREKVKALAETEFEKNRTHDENFSAECNKTFPRDDPWRP